MDGFGNFSAIFGVTLGIFTGMCWEIQVNFGVALGIFAVIFGVTLGIFTRVFWESSGEFLGWLWAFLQRFWGDFSHVIRDISGKFM